MPATTAPRPAHEFIQRASVRTTGGTGCRQLNPMKPRAAVRRARRSASEPIGRQGWAPIRSWSSPPAVAVALVHGRRPAARTENNDEATRASRGDPMLRVYTSQIGKYGGADALDITIKS